MKQFTMNRLSMALALSMSLSSCAVGPDYLKPETKLAAFHNHISSDAASEGKPAPELDVWWTGFNDPVLVMVVQRALVQNLDIAASMARVQQARAAAEGAGAKLYPTADFSTSATKQRQSLQSPNGSLDRNFPGYDRNQQEYTSGAVASWEIDLAGGLRRGAAAARDETEAAEANNMGMRVTVASDAADAYLEIRGYQSRLSVALDQVNTDQNLLDLVEVQHRYGSADDREVAQAQALLRQATSSVPPLRIALEGQLNRLDVLMGVQPGTYAKVLSSTGSGVIPAPPLVKDDSRPIEVLRRRPDVIAAERRLAAANERIGAAVAQYYPSISLSGVLGFDSISTNGLYSSQSFQPSVTGGLRWRLFDFGKVDAEVEQAKGANAESLARYRQAILQATEDVENAVMNFSQTKARQQEQQAEVDALTRARDLSEQAYKAGAITLTDVLDANRQLLVARDTQDEVRTDTSRAAVSLFRALGGGWKTTDNPSNKHE